VGKLLGFSGSEPNRASRAPRLVESHEPEIRIEIGSCDMEPSWNRVIDKLISSKSRDRVIDKVISSKSRASTLFDSPRCTGMYFNTYKQVAFFIFLHACNCMHDSTFGRHRGAESMDLRAVLFLSYPLVHHASWGLVLHTALQPCLSYGATAIQSATFWSCGTRRYSHSKVCFENKKNDLCSHADLIPDSCYKFNLFFSISKIKR
jgi:hypothetical protein